MPQEEAAKKAREKEESEAAEQSARTKVLAVLQSARDNNAGDKRVQQRLDRILLQYGHVAL